MEVVNSVKRKMKFQDLSVGDTFLKEDRRFLYIKTMPMIIASNNDRANALVLNNGAVSCFDKDDVVIAVECKVEILREGW